MAYGEIKVDSITFTANGSDATVSVSGLVQNPTFSGDITVTGTISGDIVQGGTLVSGATVSGTAGEFGTITGNTAGFTTVTGTTVTGTTVNAVSGVFTTQVSGATVTGNTGQFTNITGGAAGFTSVTGTTVTGTTANFTSGVFTTQISGTTITGNAGQFSTLTGGTAGFTTITGTTVTGTTANFVTVSGTTVTGGNGNFTAVTTTTANVTSGVFASGTAAAPSVSVGTTDNGLYSPGTDQVAISTNGTGRLFVDANGNIGVGQASPAVYFDIFKSGVNQADLRVRNGTSGLNLAIKADGTADISNVLDYPITFTTGTTPSEKLRITSAGLVGIGTSSPSRNLTVSNGTNAIIAVQNSGQSTEGVFNAPSGGVINLGTTGSYGLTLSTNSVERVRIDSSGRVGIGTTSPSFGAIDHGVHISGSGAQEGIRLETTNGSGGILEIYSENGGNTLDTRGSGYIRFNSATTEWGRWDSSGRLLVGTSTSRIVEDLQGNGPQGKIQIEATNSDAIMSIISAGTTDAGRAGTLSLGRHRNSTVGGTPTIVQDGDTLGAICFAGGDGTDMRTKGASIAAQVDGTPGANDMPGRLVFSTTADGASSPTSRVVINNAGTIIFGTNRTAWDFNADNAQISSSGAFIKGSSVTTAVDHCAFYNPNGKVGSIVTSASATAYNTSSDYRLKENVTPVTDGITRLQQLKPSRFNFIADPDKTLDGFLAHEVQTIVPEAITGEKDAVDDEGNPEYQGIDQSKLVPLLTAALQEAIGEIESLKARVAALESA